MYNNSKLISIGNFLFKYRNFLFPLTILLLFIIELPKNTFFGSVQAKIYKDYIGILFCLIGLAIRALVIGYAYIKRGGLNKKVYADDLVTTGIFAICRNPLYVGNILIYTGVFILHGNPLIFMVGVALFIFIYICIIAAEEEFLKKKFGAQFEEYCTKTPRWLPRIMQFKSATQDMYFDYKKVILKDYTTIFNTFAVVIGIEMFEQIKYSEDYASATGLGFILLFLVAAMTVIKSYKKKSAHAQTEEAA